MKIYKTSEIAKIIGVHPNTVRKYEAIGFIPKPARGENGYRIFTELHVEQCRLARTALQIELVQSGLRKKALDIIQTAAAGQFDQAEEKAKGYLQKLRFERENAEEAITIANDLLHGAAKEPDGVALTRKQTACRLQITIDTLRNWELNGLLSVKRKENGYRVYTGGDLRRLKIIRALRCANYSLSAILRMLNQLENNPRLNIKTAIDTPEQSEDIISAGDKLLTSLKLAEENAEMLLIHIDRMKNIANSPG